jgi:L-alanine-DL-glutamate epimerase-like enolase superfamily enzyme
MKRVAELADLHGILIAPHGIGVGLIGLAAQVQVAAVLPDNYIAFEYSTGEPSWWYDVLEGLPSPIVKDGFIDVWDTPGLGVHFNVDETRQYLSDEDAGFFDN